jgi:hypothetical protein
MLLNAAETHDAYLPDGLPSLENAQTALPASAMNAWLVEDIALPVRRVPTSHRITVGDTRRMQLAAESVRLVLTSPPYWTLNE